MVFVIVSIFTEQEAPKAEEKPAAVKKGKELTLTRTWLLTDEDVISFSSIIWTFFSPWRHSGAERKDHTSACEKRYISDAPLEAALVIWLFPVIWLPTGNHWEFVD